MKERAARRIRCRGPVCVKKRDEAQLHHASEMVTVGGKRYCLDCIEEAQRLAVAAKRETEDNLYEPQRIEVPVVKAGFAEELNADGSIDFRVPVDLPPEPHEQVAEAPVAPLTPRVLPAPTIQVDLGDPLMYTRFPNENVDGWPLKKGRLSASSIGTFVTCPEKFRQREIIGKREGSSGAGIAGGAAHKGVEAYFRYMMMQGEPPPWQVWHEWLHAKFDNELERETGVIEWGKQSHGDKHAFTPDEVRARAVQVAATYLDRIAPSVQPLEVESPFVVWVKGCPVPVVGSKDIVTAETVIDVKFGKAQATLDPGWRIQGLIYLLDGERDMSWHSVGWPKADGTCTYHTPLDAPTLRMPRSYENYSIASDLIRSSVQSILAYTEHFGVDNPWPGNLSHQYACDYCTFRKSGDCSWWHRRINAEDLL